MAPFVRSEEQAAVESLTRGEIQGLETLVRLHQLRAIRTAFAITRDRQTAEDVVSDAFIAAYDHIRQFDPGRPFAPWFYRIVVNGALKATRKAGRTAGGDAAAELLDRAPDTDVGPEERALVSEMQQAVRIVVRALPVKQRAVLVLRYYLQMGEQEIAQVLGCPSGTVKWRLHAARQKLRRVLAAAPGSVRSEDLW